MQGYGKNKKLWAEVKSHTLARLLFRKLWAPGGVHVYTTNAIYQAGSRFGLQWKRHLREFHSESQLYCYGVNICIA